MDEIRTLVVDDEIAFVKSLKSIIALSNRKTLSLIGNARTVEEAQSKIEEFEPDLVFLDIKLPDGTGFDVLNRCERQDFKVVFITAYDEFAVEAFKHSAVDYLLKPVSSDDLWKAIDKVQSELSSKDRELQINILMENLLELKSERKKLVLREGENMHVVSLREIRWCEAQGSYTHFHLEKGEELLVCHHLKDYEATLAHNGFLRIHRSYLVNCSKIKRYDRSEGGSLYLDDGTKLPVSFRKKEKLLKLLEAL